VGRFDGKVALVTGGASGIGRATVERLTTEGAQVCVVDQTVDAGEQTAKEFGGLFVPADVGDPAQVNAAVATCERELGGLDIAYLNAGVTTGEAAIDLLTDGQYERIRRVNVDGVVFGMRAAVPAMERRGGGALVATASLAGLIAFSLDPIYTLTKHAVVGLCRSLAPTLEPKKITVNCVCPGIVETPLVGPDGAAVLRAAGFPLLQPSDIAEAVVRVVSGGGTGEAWVCQPGRDAEPFHFGQVPGPRTPGAEGMRPPNMPS
jgi:NAD(P)-dependent dehydrogenase (short-subunit alcohol dehydrogenase family)